LVAGAGAAAGTRWNVEGDRIRIGSHPSNEVVVGDRSVSRFHCTLVSALRGWTVVDSESTNGTYLGSIRVKEADLPRPECEIRLGESVLRVREAGTTLLTTLPDLSSLGDLHGQSVAMRRVYAILERVAPTDATVLIEGESGTGKELVAHELVRRGPRANKPFITVDASSISSSLIESELFGHARGAFTGADRERKGAFEAAHGGTLLLDEIGEMPLELQPKLLRALEAREIRRVGETQARRVDVRVLVATNRDLEREVNRGQFRGDLYFRLSVVTVRLPPLRERLSDLPLLIHALLESMGALEQERLFTPAVVRQLASHDFPGNVRELRNYVERAVILGSAGSMRPGREERVVDVPDQSAGLDRIGVELDHPFKVAKDRVVAQFERDYLEQLMAWAEGNVSRAARKAKLDRMHLHRLLQRYGLKPKARSE
jgi:transcriptional regulator with GAF, ATPase, and Fis domain